MGADWTHITTFLVQFRAETRSRLGRSAGSLLRRWVALGRAGIEGRPREYLAAVGEFDGSGVGNVRRQLGQEAIDRDDVSLTQ